MADTRGINTFYLFNSGPQKEAGEKIYHQYYQWVPLVLTLQAFFFYAPHWIWKQMDNGKMNVIAR